MANTLKNAGQIIAATSTDIYTVPASTTTVVHAVWFANLHASNQVTVTVTWYDSSAVATHTILNEIVIPVNDTLIFDKPINLETGDKLSALCSSASDVEATIAMMEIT